MSNRDKKKTEPLSTGPLVQIYDQLGLADTVEEIRAKTMEGMELYERALTKGQGKITDENSHQFQFLRFYARYLVTQARGVHGPLEGVPELYRHITEQTKNDVYEPVAKNNKGHLSFLNDYVIKIYPDLKVLKVLGEIKEEITKDGIKAAPIIGVWKDEELAIAPIYKVTTHPYSSVFAELNRIIHQDPSEKGYDPQRIQNAEKVKDKLIMKMLEKEAYAEVVLPTLNEGVAKTQIDFEGSLNDLFDQTMNYTNIELTKRQYGLLEQIAEKIGKELELGRRCVSRDPSPQHYFTTVEKTRDIGDLVSDLMNLVANEKEDNSKIISELLDGYQIDWDRISYSTIEAENLCQILEHRGIEATPVDVQIYQTEFLRMKQKLEKRTMSKTQLQEFNDSKYAASFYRSFKSSVNRTKRQLRQTVVDQRGAAEMLKPHLTRDSQRALNAEIRGERCVMLDGLQFKNEPENKQELVQQYSDSRDHRNERERNVDYYRKKAESALKEGTITLEERTVLDKFMHPTLNHRKLRGK